MVPEGRLRYCLSQQTYTVFGYMRSGVLAGWRSYRDDGLDPNRYFNVCLTCAEEHLYGP